MTSPELAQALQLAAQGRAGEALPRIERIAATGDADALYVLGLWRLEGTHLPRDLLVSRSLIAQAEAAGSMQAARALSAFVATGVGAPSNWSAAVVLLDSWSGCDPIAARQLDLIAAMDLTAMGDPARAPQPEPISGSPWIVRFTGLFSAAEIAFLLDIAERRFKPALVFDESARRFIAHPYRDANVASFPAVFEWPFIHALNRRIAAASDTEARQGEPLQILRYGPGQQYRRHLDAVPGLENQRILTMLVALNDDYQGGATCFPEAGLELRGRPGDGLLFRNVTEDGRPDGASIHAGAPVVSGLKQIASRWIRRSAPPEGESFGQHEILSPDDRPGQ